MIISRFKEDFARGLQPLTRLLAKSGVHPDLLTALGLMGNVLAAVLFVSGRFRWAGGMMLIGGLCDVLDGEVARAGQRGSKFGALLDSTLDRYSEIFVAFGITVYFIRSGWVLTSAGLFFGWAGSLMVSYVRARAEGLGEECKVGMMQRGERVIAIAGGALIGVKALAVVVWIIALLANFTVAERLWHVWKKTRYLEITEGKCIE
jgi:CDP-diacylglycerol--glycerol-3-phosphate 3-phosphatidyltransferase